MEQILKYCDQCYNPNWQPKSFKEFIKLGNICREAIKEINKSDWISVEDGLPEYGEEVWVRVKDCVAGVRYFQSSRWKPEDRIPYLTYDEKNSFDIISVLQNVTHWRKIDKLEE